MGACSALAARRSTSLQAAGPSRHEFLAYVYDMRMARVNVYLPDDLAQEVKAAGLNLSKLTQEALKSALSKQRTSDWLAAVASLGSTDVSHEDVLRAVGEAKKDFGE